MADEQPNGTDTQDDEELLCMVLSRIEPIAERVRAIQELACTVLDAKADQLEKDRYARLMIQQCTGLLDYLEPLQSAARAG